MNTDSSNHLNLCFPQWQGSGRENLLYHGAMVIQRHLRPMVFETIDLPENSDLGLSNGILGYPEILDQLERCCAMIAARSPETIFTIGGDCGVEPGPVTWLNRQYPDDLALIWLDAHGDLNTPATSPSGHFHGMPLGAICGQGDAGILERCFSRVSPDQVILAGARELDPSEVDFVEGTGLCSISVERLREDPHCLAALCREKQLGRAYVHIDLDVLDPGVYKNVKHPTPGGIEPDTLCRLVENLAVSLSVVGLGIVEFVPDGGTGLSLVDRLLSAACR